MIYFDFDMSKSTNTVVYFDWKTVIYIYLRKMSHTIYAANGKVSHIQLAHVLMRLYRMDNSLGC
jgi:hypothetical protein